MDQVRAILGWLKRQHFWVLTGLVVLIGLGSWWSAAGKLSAQYKANESKIKTEFTNLSNLRGNEFHPNQTINELQARENKKLAKSVGVVWAQLYDRQREHVLEWPAALSQAFRDHVEKLPFGADIPPHLRQNYQDYVERHFPKLPEKIGARPLREGQLNPYGGGEMMMPRGMFRGEGGGGMPMTGAEEDEGDYIVEWLDQAHVREELNFPQRPSALRIWWTQENLWVYHTLLEVIRQTNELAGATRLTNAAVRTIYSIEVGRPAAQVSRAKDRIYKVQVAAAPGGEEMMGPEAGAEGEAAMMGGERGAFQEFSSFGVDGRTAMSPEQEAAFLLSHRYLGPDGKPIAAGGAGGEGGGEFADPSAAPPPVDLSSFGKEYKRLPVRMVLQMDQRWLPELIAGCASQPLQIEVEEVRINPADGGGLQGGAYGGGGFRGGFEGGGMTANLFPDRTGLLTFPQQPYMVNVVVQGVIYIFNKPETSILESTDGGEAPLAGM